MAPRMIVVAGPPGSGKSSIFPVSSFGVACFNADDRAAELNGGFYIGIPKHIRAVVNRDFEEFVLGCIDRRTSFAIETTLRSAVTLDQARLAKAAGFTTEMRYLALRDFAMHVERVKARADAGGHSASEATLFETYKLSLASLPRAILDMDDLWVYDNSPVGGPPSPLRKRHSALHKSAKKDARHVSSSALTVAGSAGRIRAGSELSGEPGLENCSSTPGPVGRPWAVAAS